MARLLVDPNIAEHYGRIDKITGEVRASHPVPADRWRNRQDRRLTRHDRDRG
jgi:hypothetical protein